MYSPAAVMQALIEAGVQGEALIAAISKIESATQAQQPQQVSRSAMRMRTYRQRRAANGMNPSQPEYVALSPSVKERDQYTCVYCGSQADLVIDHMIPVCQGGTDDMDNLATSCRRCNAAKSGRTPEQWGRGVQSPAAEAALLRFVAVVAQQHSTKKEIPHTPLEKTNTTKIPDSAREAGEPTPSKAPVSRGTRLPADFCLAPHIARQAAALGLSEADISDQLERFRDWANAATGQVSIKRDWQAAARNWLKRAADDKRKRHQHTTSRSTAAKGLSDAFDGINRELDARHGPAGSG